VKKIILICAKVFENLCRLAPSFLRFQPVRGVFSAYDELNQKKLIGKTLVEYQPNGKNITGSITDLAAMAQYNHQPWPVFWVKSNDARLVGRMLEWRNSKDRICYEGAFRNTNRRSLSEDRFLAQIILEPSYYLPGAWTSIISKWGHGNNYYHWILDSLTRLLVREHFPEETRIIIPPNMPSFVRETLEMLDLTESVFETPSSCILPERFYFCSPTAMTGSWNPLGYEWLREKFSKFRHSCANGSPIFLTRRGSKRIPKNLNEIESLFEKNGFQIINCGDLTVKEQIELASTAPAIAGVHGAAMTNILWANSGIPILEIFQPNYLNGCYEQIANQGKLPYNFIILKDGADAEISLWLKKLNVLN
jgi:hypothetical protein